MRVRTTVLALAAMLAAVPVAADPRPEGPVVMELTLENGDAVIADLGAAPAATGQSIVKAMERVGMTLAAHVQKEKLSGQLLQVRSGMGRRSIFYRVVEDTQNQGAAVFIGADLDKARYMRAQEKGAVIRPKRGRYLTIPLEAARTGKGVARFTARELFDNPQAHGYIDAFVAKGVIFGVRERVRGRGADRQAVGGFGSIVPLFALKTQVTIKPVGYLKGTLEEKLAWIHEQFDEAAREAVTVVINGQSQRAG